MSAELHVEEDSLGREDEDELCGRLDETKGELVYNSRISEDCK